MWRRKSRQFVTAGLLIVGAVVAAAQDKPDFSGRWVLIDPASSGPDTPRGLSVRQPLARTTARGEPMTSHFRDIAISREYQSGTRTETYAIGVAGGVVPGLRADGSQDGPRGHHAVKWDQDALVFESGSYTGKSSETGTWSERREVWSLVRDGRLQVTITTSSSVDTARTRTLMYQRR